MSFIKKDTRSFAASAILGSFFGLCSMLIRLETLSASPACGLKFIGGFLLFAAIYTAILFLLYSLLDRLELSMGEKEERNVTKRRLFAVFFAAFAVLMIWFCMWMLFRYPGCMSPDSTWQLMQARGLEPLSNHHPVVHTLLIRFCINIGISLTGNPSAALAAYTLVQSAMLSAAFSYLIMTMYKLRVRRWAVIAVFLSLIVLPYHATIAVTMLKDVWFSAFVLLLITTLWRMLSAFGGGRKSSPWDIGMLFVSSLGMCLFRTNGLYAFIVFLPFFLVCFFKKSKPACAAAVAAAALAVLVTGPLYSSLGIAPPDTIEALSIPTQHITRAVVDGAELNEEQLALLNSIVDVDAAVEAYCPWLVDPVKLLVRNSGDQEYLAAHKGEFIKLWVELGLENPLSYLLAHIDLTGGYWYPKTDGMVIYPYFADTGSNSSLCMLPAPLASALSAVARNMPSMPVVKYLFSNGAAVWLYLALFTYAIAKKRYSGLILFVPVLAVWLTLLIATPLDNEFRYAYSVFTTLPLLCVVPFTPLNRNKAPEA